MESGLLSPESVLEVCSWIPESGFGSPEFGHGVQKWESRCGVWSQKSWSLKSGLGVWSPDVESGLGV